MAALTCDRNTHRRPTTQYRDPVAAGARIFAGAMVALEGGYARPASEAAGLAPRGMALKTVDNRNGTAGEVAIDLESGCFGLKTDGGMGRTHIGKEVYFVDDQTVSATGGASRSAAGILKDIEGEGHGATAWVQVG